MPVINSAFPAHTRAGSISDGRRWAHYGLPRSYPLVAPDYAKTRSALAKKIGLGRKGGRPAGRKWR